MATELIVDCLTGQTSTQTFTPGPPPVPHAVTPLQMRRALRSLGLTASITAYVNAMGAEAQEAWEYATEIRRDDALVNAAGVALGKTSGELDDIFRLAQTMTAP